MFLCKLFEGLKYWESFVMAEITETKVDIPKLAEELDNASPLEIMDRALALYGPDIAIAFR